MERRSASCCVSQSGSATYTIETVLRCSRQSPNIPPHATTGPACSSSVGSRVLALVPETKQTTQASHSPWYGKRQIDAALVLQPQATNSCAPPWKLRKLPYYLHAVIHDQKAHHHHQCMLSRRRHESRKVYLFHMCHTAFGPPGRMTIGFPLGHPLVLPPVRLQRCCRGCRGC